MKSDERTPISGRRCRPVDAGTDLAPQAGMHDRERKPLPAAGRAATDLEEVEHLLEGFTDELRKLDEALELLAAYLVRLQQSARGDRLLH